MPRKLRYEPLPARVFFGVPVTASNFCDRTPLSAGAVISLGAEIKELTATGATKAVTNNILPRPLWDDRGEGLPENRRTRRNLDDGAIRDVVARDSYGPSEVSRRADLESLAQGCTALTI